MHEITRDEGFFVYFLGGILRCIFCCLSVLRLSGNNGFLFILLAHRRRLSQGLLLPPVLFPPVSVLLQRHEFGAEGRISPWPAPLHFSFVSLTISFPSTTTTLPSVTVCQLHSTAPSCLHIAWSKTTNWSFTACSLSALLSLSHRSLPSSHFFFFYFLRTLSLRLTRVLVTPLASATTGKCRTPRKWNDTLKNGIVGR